MVSHPTPIWKNPQFVLTILAVSAVMTSAYVHIQDMDARVLRMETLISDHEKRDADEARSLDKKFESLNEIDRGSLVDRRDVQARLLRLEGIVERNSSRLDRLEGLQWKNRAPIEQRFGAPHGADTGG
jgi:hypothetical protein